jgi:hypothetical protein
MGGIMQVQKKGKGEKGISRGIRVLCVQLDAQGRSNILMEHRNNPKTEYTFRSDALRRAISGGVITWQ